jgi:hypothetical protein
MSEVSSTQWGRYEMHTEFQSKNLKGRDHLEDLSIDGSVILKCVLKKYGVRMWTGFIWLRIGSSADSCEHDNEP